MTTLNSATMTFLADLAANNRREWFAAQRDRYDAARLDVQQFAAAVLEEVLCIDPLIPPQLKGSQCVMRLFRDTRFAKDKAPYKTNFGIGISRFGSKLVEPGYYVHIAPDACFIAAGWWMPPADGLKAIRMAIAARGDVLQGVLAAPAYQQHFAGFDDYAVLKTMPRGFAKDHPHAELLRLKSFTCSQPLPPDAYQQPDCIARIPSAFAAARPMLDFLRGALGEAGYAPGKGER
ncbi:DUF2461 domain-containing protein [Chitinilyticum piscinae]|uniref:DUF2461 domain-containing protein n=1 Tax=Chitinilyticum piscinae TaxID=2866724 RepID=A0A8J7KBC2_9NEIS|nr:DUF2461 domain-containing protein [Chitinilyticum piscinae]MBE9610084.1 DUF2461 domain-containing protein [Chitinilyticum piscinae]